MFNNILIINTGLRFKPALAQHGIELAARTDATLHILYIGMTGGYSPNSLGFVDRRIPPEEFSERAYREFVVEKQRKRGEKAVEPLTEMAAKRGVETVVTFIPSVDAKPDRLIHRYAAENDVGLLIVGIRNRQGPLTYLTPSVAGRVGGSSPLSVLTVDLSDRQRAESDRSNASGTPNPPTTTPSGSDQRIV